MNKHKRSIFRIANQYLFLNHQSKLICWRHITIFMDGPKKYKVRVKNDLAPVMRGKVEEVVKVEINMNHYLISSHTHMHSLSRTHTDVYTHAHTFLHNWQSFHLLNRQLPAYWLAHRSSLIAEVFVPMLQKQIRYLMCTANVRKTIRIDLRINLTQTLWFKNSCKTAVNGA